jgi:hypothetical protein
MRPLTYGLPGALATLLRDVPLSPGKVEFAWKTAVGGAVERVTAVRLDGHVLLVEVPDRIWEREIARSSPVILRRLRNLLGSGTVAEIRIRKPLA